MDQNDKIQFFEDKRIRTAWDEEHEVWYFSIVDEVAVLTDSGPHRCAGRWAVLYGPPARPGIHNIFLP